MHNFLATAILAVGRINRSSHLYQKWPAGPLKHTPITRKLKILRISKRSPDFLLIACCVNSASPPSPAYVIVLVSRGFFLAKIVIGWMYFVFKTIKRDTVAISLMQKLYYIVKKLIIAEKER